VTLTTPRNAETKRAWRYTDIHLYALRYSEFMTGFISVRIYSVNNLESLANLTK
jgi:hypothetical protein